MESFEVLEQAIPRAQSGRVAQILSISADYVRRWRREPDTDENVSGTGQRSILDRICDLIDAVYLVNPSGTALIVNYIQSHHDTLLRTHAQPIPCRDSQAEAGASLLTEATQAVNAIQVEGVSDNTLRELVELRDKTDFVIKQVERTRRDSDNVRPFAS